MARCGGGLGVWWRCDSGNEAHASEGEEEGGPVHSFYRPRFMGLEKSVRGVVVTKVRGSRAAGMARGNRCPSGTRRDMRGVEIARVEID